MQRWEYLDVQAVYEGGLSRVKYMNGIELRDWKKHPHVMQTLTQLGNDGWELVGLHGSGYDAMYYAFKRPKA